MNISSLLRGFFKFAQSKSKPRKPFERRRRSRIRHFEMLEARHMLAAAIWHNVLQPLNVSGEPGGTIDPLDALIVINEINDPKYSNHGSLVRDVPPGQSLPYFDVTCDSSVDPLDVLSIINAINLGTHDPSWNFSASNNSIGSSGHVGISSCSPLLVEGDSLATELNKTVVLRDSTSAIRVSFEAPTFDTMSQNAIRDAFEILLLDESGQPLLLPFAANRQASYNWSENIEPGFGAGTQTTTLPNGFISTATFNLTGLAMGTKVQVVARLVNDDTDTTTSVVIRSVEIIDVTVPAPTGMAVPDAIRSPSAPVDANLLVDVSSIVKPVYGRTTLLEDSGVLVTDLQVINVGDVAVSGRILVAIDNLSDATIGVMHPDGFLAGGRPYFVVNGTSGSGWLATGQSTTKREVRFINPSNQQFTYSLTTLAELNLPPTGFSSVPLREIEASKTYHTVAKATDPEGQALYYSIVAGPAGLTVGGTTGDVRWITLASDIGNHSVILRATDPFGLSVDQTFTISVFASLPNRPPVFTSTPPTEAKVAGAFEVITIKTGTNPVAIAAGNFGTGTSYVTANSGDANLSLNQGPSTTTLNIGEPKPDGRYFRTGTNVDVGLPYFANASDSQRLDSIAQADLNGDGNLDFVSANYVFDAASPGTPRIRFLAVAMGNGDSTFDDPTKLPIRTVLNDSNEERRPVGSLLIRDFDGDGKLDLLGISYVDYNATEQNQLLFWHGFGDGTFKPVAVRDPGVYVGRIRAADFNGDGKLDLVATSATWDRIGILPGNGDGTFGGFVEILNSPGAGYYHTEGIADLDGKNGPDIAISSYNRREIDIFLNNGTGTLAKATSLAIGNNDPLGLFTGDFTGDGFQDIVAMTRNGSAGGGISIYKGSGDGIAFALPIEAGGGQPRTPVNVNSDTAPVDLNGDGKLDLVFSHHDGDFGVTVGLNKGDGTFDLQTYQNVSPPAVVGNINVQELSVIVGDYNRDGMLDLAVPSTYRAGGQAYAGLTLFLAKSPGKYAAPTDHYFAGTGINTPFTGVNYAADFNNDGNVDLFGVLFQSGDRIQFGNGDGTFQAAIGAAPYIGNEFYNSGFHSDFNNDGFEDVLWVSGGGVQGGPRARVIVGFNTGSGAFNLVVYGNPDGDYYYVGSVVAGDFNRDGHTDFAGRGNGYVDVWLYDAAAGNSFTRTSRLSLPPGEASDVLSAADFNGDGIDDLVTATGRNGNIGRNYSLLHTFANLGGGNFGPIQTQPLFNTNSDAVVPRWSAAGDVNNDGLQDLVITSAYSRSSVLLGKGDGTFQVGSDYVTGTSSASGRSVYLRDLNDDRNLDMIVIDDNQTKSVLRVRYGDGEGNFGPEESYAAPNAKIFVDFADFDRDGTTDAVLGGSNASTILFGTGPGLTGIATGDVNGDGKLDTFAVIAANNRVKILLGNGDATFARQPDVLVGNGPIAVASIDLNNDGKLDIVTANKPGKSVSILAGTGGGSFVRADISTGALLTALAVGDLNGDRKPDILAASTQSKALYLMANNNGTFSLPTLLPLGDTPGAIAIGDLTGDSINDIAISLPDSMRLMVLPGDGLGGFGTPLYVMLNGAASGLGLADFNADGRLDIAITQAKQDRAAILFGRGQGRFAVPQTIAVGDKPISLTIQDINADGRPDILVANQGDHTASVIVNRYDPSNLYRYQAAAFDPDGDPIRYDLADAPGGMLQNPVTGEIIWAPTVDQIGLNSVTVRASDSQGGSATQSFRIGVLPNRESHSPVIFSQAPATLDATQAYKTTLTALDPDHDSLRYRLLSGPTGATVNPTTGEVNWDPRRGALQLNATPSSSGYVNVPMSPSLKPQSITVEGFYRIDSITKATSFFRKSSYAPYPATVYTLDLYYDFGQLTAQIGGNDINGSPGKNKVALPWNPVLHQWYQFALTFNDATGVLSVYVDGHLFMQLATGRHLIYDDQPLMIGEGYFSPLIGAVAQFREWDYARSASELRNGILREVASNAPGLILDYRFEDGESLTVHDHSGKANNAQRVYGNGRFPSISMGLAFEQTQYFAIQVEDGKGGFSENHFGVTVVPPQKHAITGTVFSDDDGNGSQNLAEVALQNITVYVDSNANGVHDASEPFTLTDSQGRYSIPDQLAGIHRIAIEPRAGFAFAPIQYAILDAFDNANVFFGLIPGVVPSIRGKVLIDLNGNGAILDNLPIYSSNVNVYLDVNNNKVLDEGESFQLTDSFGNYAFSGLYTNNWHVRLANRAGWTTTSPASNQYDIVLLANGSSIGNDFVLHPSISAASQPRFVTRPQDYATARVPYRFENVAVDPGFLALTYSLESAPEGMSIEPSSGIIVWTPRISQQGTQSVVIRAINDRGGIALQDFTIDVSRSNSDPIITSQAPTGAQADVAFRYNVFAQDAEQSALAYTLLAKPVGANIDSVTGRITWLPVASQVGTQQFTVQVRDLQGGIAEQAFSIEVTFRSPNNQPTFAGSVRSQTAVTLPYSARIMATDPDSDPLTFALVNGPIGMTVAMNGSLNWTPTVAQFGLNNVKVSVDDGRGGIAVREFTINVVNTLSNHNPSITTTAANFAVAGKVYRYDIAAIDADNDPIAFELVAGPNGLSLDPIRGTVRWIPAVDQFGQHAVTVRALDPFGGVSEQNFAISVRAVGGPPAITSIPPTSAAVGNTYLYTVVASDAEGDPLNFSLLSAPVSMILSAVTGELIWTPTEGDVGLRAVVIQVSDGVGGFATQTFAVQVAAGTANQPPTITSPPPLFASANLAFTTKVVATDPENTAITYSLRRGPAGMQVDPGTGEVTWLPMARDIGTIIVAFTATDALGATAVQSFELSVLAANIAPIILSTAPNLVIARGIYRYDVLARDANLDPLKFEFVSNPIGMTIDAFGRIRWQTNITDLGSHIVLVRVSDPRGGFAEQRFTFGVLPDTSAPRVTVIPSTSVVRANSLEVFTRFNLTPVYPSNTVRISAIDDVGVTNLLVTANGKPIALDAFGIATFNFKDWGFGGITVVAKASDAAGNVGTGAKAFAFLPYGDDPAVADLANPIVVITSPIASEAVMGFVNIQGSATSDNFTSYTLSYRRGDLGVYKTISSGTSRVIAGTLGKWDTTLLENDEYFLRLEVQDEIFGTTVFEESIGVSGSFKLGNFRLSFTDITIPVAGIPITLARTYDTLRSDRDSELGFGWRLEFRNADLRTGLAKTGLEDLGIYRSFKQGTKVYLTLPGGTRQGYTFTPEIRSFPGIGNSLTIATPRFTPDRGVRNMLSVRGGSYVVKETGELVSGGGQPYNPAAEEFGGGYTLTTPEGIIYRIDGKTGMLVSAKDRNDNLLIFTDSGIRGGGVNLSFERDARGRITKAIDPAGNSVQYTYDQRGDLTKVTDRERNASSYLYKTTPAHFLEKVTDPLGRTGVRSEYAPNGRLSSTRDAAGHTTAFSYDPANSLATRVDGNGNPWVIEFDAIGNVVAQTNPLGGVDRNTYDANDNLLSATDPLGNITAFQYDADGNTIRVTDPLGGITRNTYLMGMVISTTDAAGNSSLKGYDNRGNLISSTNSLGLVTSYIVDSAGNVLSITDPLGYTQSSTYDALGRVTSQTDRLGVTTSYKYDVIGNLIKEDFAVMGTTGLMTRTTTTNYNANGDAVRVTDPAGGVTTFAYDAAGNRISTINTAGRSTTVVYDPTNLPAGATTAGGRTTSFAYDGAGNRITITDAAGQTTQKKFDALGRLISVVFQDETPANAADNPRKRFEYDAVGRQIAFVDERNFRTTFEYDARGQLVKSIDPLGAIFKYSYDVLGNRVSEIDPLGNTTNFTYDKLGQLTRVRHPDGGIVNYQFDNDGNKIAITDAMGRTTASQFDPAGKLIRVTDALGETIKYTYDEAGNMLSVTDANGRITRFEYDALDRPTATVTPNGGRTSVTYDLAGNAVSQTDADGRVTEQTFNADGQVLMRRLPGGGIIAFTYAPSGQTTTMTDLTGTTTFTYDVRDRLASRNGPDGRTISYQYDAAGNRTGITTPGGTVMYAFDGRNHTILVNAGTSGTSSFAYDLNGNPTNATFADNTTESRAYDSSDRLLSIRTANASNVTLLSINYSYDLSGLQTAIDETGAKPRHVQYTYDRRRRLTGETIIPDIGAARQITYTYDAAGNRITRSDSAVGITTSTYDVNDRLLSETINGLSTRYTYDASGNTLTRTTGADQTLYSYTSDHRLASVFDTTGGVTHTTTYRNTGDGLRVSQIVDGLETRYLVDDNRAYSEVLEEYAANGTLLAYYVANDSVISVRRGIATTVLHADARGTTRLATVNGIETAFSMPDAFGRVLTSGGAVDSLPGFLGRTASAGLVNLRARDYDPQSGRFRSVDANPISPNLPFETHRFEYAGSDPVNNMDPSGLFGLAEVLVSTGTASTIMRSYTQNLGKLLLTTIRISACVIKPGNQLRTMGARLIEQGVPRGETIYDHGTQMIAAGFKAIEAAIQKAYKDIADELSPSLAKFKAVGKPAPKPNYNSWLDDIKDYYDKQKKEFLKKDVKGRVEAGQKFADGLVKYYLDLVTMLGAGDNCDRAKLLETYGTKLIKKIPKF